MTEGPAPTFTIFTPTRNRAHVLHRVYDSLVAQTFRDFEWLIVDNGSTDGTTQLVSGWQAAAAFPIRYVWQQNAGLHASWNRAAREAHGRFLLGVRSADTFVPTALGRFQEVWASIPDTTRDGYVGVSANCVDELGRFIGTPFPATVFDSDALEIRFRYKVRGEKWGFQRIELVRAHPLPEPENYLGYVPEGLMWMAIARQYRTRYVNEVLRTYWQDQAESMSSPKRRSANAYGEMLDAESLLNHDLRWARHVPLVFLRRAFDYVRMAHHAGRPVTAQLLTLRPSFARILWLAVLVPGSIVYWLDMLRERRADRANAHGAGV